MSFGIFMGAAARGARDAFKDVQDFKTQQHRNQLLEDANRRAEQKHEFEQKQRERQQRTQEAIEALDRDAGEWERQRRLEHENANQPWEQIGPDGRPVAGGVQPQAPKEEYRPDLVALADWRRKEAIMRGMPQEVIDRENKAYVQTRLQQAKLELEDAMRGGPQGLAEFYQKFTPYDDKVEFAGQGEDGSLVYNVQLPDGKTYQERFGSFNEAVSFLRSGLSLENFLDEEKMRLERWKVDNASREVGVKEDIHNTRKRAGYYQAEAEGERARAESARASASVARQPKELTIMDELVKRGVARSAEEAWQMVQTGKGKTPETLAAQLLSSQNPRYMGGDGRERALEDARAIIARARSESTGSAAAPGGTGKKDFSSLWK